MLIHSRGHGIGSADTLRLVISNKDQAPDWVIRGEHFDRPKAAGMICHNEAGVECGALVFRGTRKDRSGWHRESTAEITVPSQPDRSPQKSPCSAATGHLIPRGARERGMDAVLDF